MQVFGVLGIWLFKAFLGFEGFGLRVAGFEVFRDLGREPQREGA